MRVVVDALKQWIMIRIKDGSNMHCQFVGSDHEQLFFCFLFFIPV
jgi:hypothetical protein